MERFPQLPEVSSKLLQLCPTQLSVPILVNQDKNQFDLVHVVLSDLAQQVPGGGVNEWVWPRGVCQGCGLLCDGV